MLDKDYAITPAKNSTEKRKRERGGEGEGGDVPVLMFPSLPHLFSFVFQAGRSVTM